MEQLSQFFKQITNHNNREPKNLYNPIDYVLSQDGKHLRPQMVYISTQLFNGPTEAALYPAAAFEL
ncbi:MAG TPA: polyprenyl synthetase family protein, partial [Bacteroidales bacterium]|nr:polyprenyl synthetase family protein [Bacteroidales bacterium]